MGRRIVTFSSLTALAVVVSIGTAAVSAAPASRPQRIMLVEQHRFGAPTGTFVLHALSPGPLSLDSGSHDYAAAERPPVIRDGQGIAVYVLVEAFAGKRGTIVVRSRIELVGAGNGTTVGTGSWSIVRGTRAYAGLRGGGRAAVVVMTPGGFTSSQYEGLVRTGALQR